MMFKDAPVTNPFVNAAMLGNLDDVHQRLLSGEDVNQRDTFIWDNNRVNPNTYGKTALYFALRNHDLELLKLLDVFGVDFELESHSPIPLPVIEKTTLHTTRIAANTGFIEGLKYLADAGHISFDPNDKESNWEILSSAVSGRNDQSLETLRHLVEQCGLTDFEAPEGKNDLIHCTEGNPEHEHISFEIASYLLGYARDVLGKPIDLNRSRWREPKMKINVLPEANEDFKKISGLSFGAFSELHRTYSNLALTHAAFSANQKRVALYLEFGADPFLRDHNGISALDAVLDKRNPWHTPARYKPIENLIRTAQAQLQGNVAMFIAPKPALPE